MKDIKSLYRRAKFGGPADRAAYAEAVKEAQVEDPVGYLSQLEYIICSGVGLESFGAFVEAHSPLPLAVSRAIAELADKLAETDPQRYRSFAERANEHLDRHQYLLAMFESFETELPADYLESAVGRQLTFTQALDRFGAAAIPDCLLGCFDEADPRSVLEYAAEHPVFSRPEMKQWLLEAAEELELGSEVTARLTENSLAGTYREITERTELTFREAALTGNEDLKVSYSETELEAMQALHDHKSYLMTCLRTESARLEAWQAANEAGGELAKLVEEDESCSDLAAMLPFGGPVKVVNEGRDAKTGRIPNFISNHHDLSYGEEDDVPPRSKPAEDKSDTADGPDYSRPTPGTKSAEPDRDDDEFTVDEDDDGKPRKHQGTATTYNYYNYYNSFNRSHRVDNSKRSTDNSVNKRVNSDNVGLPTRSELKESVAPFTLFDNNLDYFDEGKIWDLIQKIIEWIRDFFRPKKIYDPTSDDEDIFSVSDSRLPTELTEAFILRLLPKYDSIDCVIMTGKDRDDTVSRLGLDTTAKYIVTCFPSGTKPGDDAAFAAVNRISKSIRDKWRSATEGSKNYFVRIVRSESQREKQQEKQRENVKVVIGPTTTAPKTKIPRANVNAVEKAIANNDLKAVRKEMANALKTDFSLLNFKAMETLTSGLKGLYETHRTIHKPTGDDKADIVTFCDDLLTNFSIKRINEIQEMIVRTYWGVNKESGELVIDGVYYDEGWKETLGKFVSSIKSMVTMKKSLANLQRLDLPSEISKKQPITLLGGIPIPNRGAKTEAVELISDPELITEAFSFFGLGKKDIAQMIDRLRKKFRAEILIVESNPQIDQLIGPASVIETTREAIEKIVKGDLPEMVPTAVNTLDRSGFEKVILVNARMLKAIGADTPKRLELIISHEYGHVLTFDQLSQRDWLEYMTKRQLIGSLLQAVLGFEMMIYLSQANLYYYKLKPERLANETSHINPMELSEAITGSKPEGSIPGLNLDAVVNWEMPELIFKHASMAAAGKQASIPGDELIENMKISVKLYEKVITDTGKRRSIISDLKSQIKAMNETLAYERNLAGAKAPRVKLEAGEPFGGRSGDRQSFGRSSPVPVPEHGFTIHPGSLSKEEIEEKLVDFMKSEYFEKENRVISAVKAFAADEHNILGNVVMEPGLETMWTDLYHIEEMLTSDYGNVIFEADTGSTILFEHIVGSNKFDPEKVSWEKLEALIDQYHMDRSIIDELRKMNGDDITSWDRMDWGNVAWQIYEKFTFPKLKAMKLPENCQLAVYADDTSWDGIIGANLIFTDLGQTVREFNEKLGDGGTVTSTTVLIDEHDYVESVKLPDLMSVVVETGTVPDGPDGIEITPGTMTEKEIASQLVAELARTYQPQLKRLYADLGRRINHDRRIVGQLRADYLGNFDWNDPYYFENVCLIGTRSEGAIFTASHFRDHPGSLTMVDVETFFREHGIPMKVMPAELEGTEPSGWGHDDLQQLDQAIFTGHTWPIIRSAANLPANVNLYRIATYDYDGFGIQFTDVGDLGKRFSSELGDGGTVLIRVTPYKEGELVESGKAEPEEEDPAADPERPTSDHPVKDTIQDIDRVLTKTSAAAKKRANDAINVGKVVAKPFKRTVGWIDNLINRFKDADETKVKEQMADPHSRSAVFKAIRFAIVNGALLKAGLLLNPIFLFLAATNTIAKRRKNMRLRSEIIGQLKAEIEVTEEKIQDANRASDNAAKYKLMRFKTELERKLLRVGGGKEAARIL